MVLTTALLLCMVCMWQDYVSAEYDQSCHISPQLEEECSVYAHQVTKPMLGYFEQVTQKIDRHSAEMETKNEQIKHLQEKETALQRELDGRNEQIRQQGESKMKLQLENMNYKLKETAVFNDLRQKIEQLPKNLCEYQNKELKELKAKEIDLQRELERKNEQIRQLGENMIKLRGRLISP